MQQSRLLKVYPNSRSIREYLKSVDSDHFLPKFITIGEFEKKSIFVKDRVFIDDDTRILLLKEASDFESFKSLDIDREFFSFLKNSKLIFSFFDELSLENISLDILLRYDYYELFNEHISILKELRKRYLALLDERGYYDKMTMPLYYSINREFIESFDEITLFLEGYLSSFELEVFEKISQRTTFKISLVTDRFNKKMIEKINRFGFDLKEDREYLINLSKKEIISEDMIKNRSPKIEIFSSNSRVMQIAFIKKSVYDFVNLGIDPEKIAVIIPDINMVDTIDLFNEEKIFNFAMGRSYTNSKIYKKLDAIYLFLKDSSIENRYRLSRYKIGDDYINDISNRYIKRFSVENMKSEFLKLSEDEEFNNEELQIYNQELHLFSKLLPSLTNYKFVEVLHLFLNRLKSRRIDDVGGGKVTVIELLESRRCSFDAVILIDFNEGRVPHKNQKDMFLSSDLRAIVGLPTINDRQNLQKYYYKRLIDNTKYVYISYIEDEQNIPSRFLDELSISAKSRVIDPRNYHNILFYRSPKKSHIVDKEIVLEYDFKNIELSSSRFNDFLECHRRYYYKYIKKIDEAIIPTDDKDERVVGIYLHEALKEFYKKRDYIEDSDELLFGLQNYLYQKIGRDIVLKFYIDLWLERLKEFSKHELSHFQKGFRVKECEIDLKCEYRGFKLRGKIDRIDIKDGKLYVIDYKSGNIPKSKNIKELDKERNFQLQFYHILASQLGEVAGGFYYDLKGSKLVEDNNFDKKLELFDKKLDMLNDTTINFSMCEDSKSCKFCPYNIICDRVGL